MSCLSLAHTVSLQVTKYSRAQRVGSVGKSLNLIKCHRFIPPLLQCGSSGGLVAGHLLGNLKLSTVLQVDRDAGGAKTVGADLRITAADAPTASSLAVGWSGRSTKLRVVRGFMLNDMILYQNALFRSPSARSARVVGKPLGRIPP